MKTKKLFSFFLVAALAIGFISCDSDDDEDGKENKFTYGNTSSKITGAAVQKYSEDNYHYFQVALIGEGLTLDLTNEITTGAGYLYYIGLYSVDGTLEGDYSYIRPTAAISPKSAITTDLFYNSTLSYLTANDEGEVVDSFDNEESTISIKKDGDKYEVIIKGVGNEEEKAFELYYKGLIPNVSISM